MNEFAQYSYTNLAFIAVGSSICMVGIMYKVCTLENADLHADESDKFTAEESEGEEVEMTLNASKKSNEEKFMKVSDSNDDNETTANDKYNNIKPFDEIIESLKDRR